MTERVVRDINKDELDTFAGEVLVLLKAKLSTSATTLALYGDLGSGKTTFTQALGRCLHINENITSPTFTIMKSYETFDDTFTQLIHMDAYRIESEEELIPLHFKEILKNPQTLVVVEWAELVKGALPPEALHLTFSIKDQTTRTVQID
ncbi:MAG: tRNA (adenosine(37)-N6)-threonylcarbamoyltransferase complex ATPase subunit type 1 TsaE [Patescibacteria group bacterium]